MSHPLAAAAGPEARRRLKQGRCRSAASACGEGSPSSPAAASEPASLDLVPGPALAASIAGTVLAAELATSTAVVLQGACFALGPRVCSMSRARKAGSTNEVAAGPPALSREPYSGHLATRLGRSGLWCLHCFRRPAGPYQAWLRERCRQEQPISAMPVALSSALLRAIDADASDCLRRRLAVLLAAARVVPVPQAANPQARRQEEGKSQEH